MSTSSPFGCQKQTHAGRKAGFVPKTTVGKGAPFLAGTAGVYQCDDRTCQNLSKRRALSAVILANWPLALANSWGPTEPVAKRLSRTACTVLQLRPAALQGIRTPSSRRLSISGPPTCVVVSPHPASA